MESKKQEILEWEGKYKIFCEQFLDVLNIREQYSAENEKELDMIAKLSSSAHKNWSKMVGVGQFVAEFQHMIMRNI